MPRSKFTNMFKAGQRIGRWTVTTGDVEFDPKSRAFIEVKCNCGHCKMVECSSLTRNKSLRCENCNYSSRGRAGEQNPNWKGYGIVPKTTLDRVAVKASRTTAPPNTIAPVRTKFPSIDAIWLNNAYNGSCTVSGVPITPEVRTATVVRNDVSIGYTPDNISWVSADIAPLVDKMGVQAFVNMCQNVVNYQSRSLKGE